MSLKLISAYFSSLNRHHTLALWRLRVDNYCLSSFFLLELLLLLVLLTLVPNGLVLAQQSLLLAVFGPVDGDDFAEKLAVVHVENRVLPVLMVLVLDQREVPRYGHL